MASINGISAKAITKFSGHEGEPCYQGNLYLNNRKIAFWSQDSWGGGDNFIFEPKYSVRKLNDKLKALNPDKAWRGGTPEKPFVMEYDLERMLCDFINLWIDEQEFKKAVKVGFGGIMVVTDGCHIVSWRLPKSYTALSSEALFSKMNKEITEAKKGFFKEDEHTKHSVKVYRSTADFEIGAPVSIEDILTNK